MESSGLSGCPGAVSFCATLAASDLRGRFDQPTTRAYPAQPADTTGTPTEFVCSVWRSAPNLVVKADHSLIQVANRDAYGKRQCRVRRACLRPGHSQAFQLSADSPMSGQAKVHRETRRCDLHAPVAKGGSKLKHRPARTFEGAWPKPPGDSTAEKTRWRQFTTICFLTTQGPVVDATGS